MTWSCRHLGDSSWCSPSGKGQRHRFCHQFCRSLHSRSLWHHFLDTAGRWGNPRRTALAALNRKAERLCWTLGGGEMEEVSQNQIELCGGVGAIAEDERHEKHDTRKKISTKKQPFSHWNVAGVQRGNRGINSDPRIEQLAWQTTPREHFTTQPQTLS